MSGTPRPLAIATEVVLLRVCQEALANVRKHSGADKATVRLRYEPDAVLLEIVDDGSGFDPTGVSRRLRPERDRGRGSPRPAAR